MTQDHELQPKDLEQLVKDYKAVFRTAKLTTLMRLVMVMMVMVMMVMMMMVMMIRSRPPIHTIPTTLMLSFPAILTLQHLEYLLLVGWGVRSGGGVFANFLQTGPA